jgi:acetyl coenzyme A synthetase (ADP forming)-like protein
VKDLKRVFEPSSVAVVGASTAPGKIGHSILRNIIDCGFSGDVYPINPKADEILGLKAYASIADVPDQIDLAVISIPAELVLASVEECGRRGVGGAVIITSGFGEVGEVEAESKLKDLADRYEMALIGPNVFGIVYTPVNLNATFGLRDVLPGRLAFVTQSGALGVALMGWTVLERIGLSALVSIGNKADISDKELIEYFNSDPNVDVVMVYMEGTKDGRRFASTRVEKPVIVIKAGRSAHGSKAAASHTGSLAGADRIYDAAFGQLGMMRAKTIQEAFAWASALCLPSPEDHGTVIITNGGGIGVMTTDEAEDVGLQLLDDHDWLEARFKNAMPYYGSAANPIDITGQGGAETYRKAVKIALGEDRIQSVVFLFCETAITNPMEIARAISEEFEQAGRNKPIVASFIGGEPAQKAIVHLKECGIPAFNSPALAVSALRAVYRWKEISSRKRDTFTQDDPPSEAISIVEDARANKRASLMEHEARRVLELCGVPMPKWAFAATADEAARLADGMYPLAMKIDSPDIVHKTDVGGVALNVRDRTELEVQYARLMERVALAAPEARLAGVTLTQMVDGLECVVGLTRDPQFGPVVMFGLGGILVEVMQDVAFRIVPFGEVEASRMLDEISAREVLDGFRGIQAHRDSLVRTLCAVQRLATIVREVDINPLMTNEAGSFAVDARVIL